MKWRVLMTVISVLSTIYVQVSASGNPPRYPNGQVGGPAYPNHQSAYEDFDQMNYQQYTHSADMRNPPNVDLNQQKQFSDPYRPGQLPQGVEGPRQNKFPANGQNYVPDPRYSQMPGRRAGPGDVVPFRGI